VKILPIPHTLDLSTNNFEVGRRTVGMLGPARSTKGFHFYPRLAAALAAREDTHIVLQSQVLFNRDRDSLIAREILKHSPNVTLIEESLSQDDYHRVLNSIDLLALPYQLSYYHSQTSGILAEGASLGKPCVIPKGTWMHEQLESNLVSGLAFEPGNVEDFVVNVQKVLDEFSSFKDIALARMSDWNKTHNALSFVSEIRNVVK
jgi:glycosyltransferase involved in cell wall biosynthesis